MSKSFDPSGGEGRKISDRTAGRAGAVITMSIWFGCMVLFEAKDFSPIPHSVLVISVLFGGGFIGWRAATEIARRRFEKRQANGEE